MLPAKAKEFILVDGCLPMFDFTIWMNDRNNYHVSVEGEERPDTSIVFRDIYRALSYVREESEVFAYKKCLTKYRVVGYSKFTILDLNGYEITTDEVLLKNLSDPCTGWVEWHKIKDCVFSYDPEFTLMQPMIDEKTKIREEYDVACAAFRDRGDKMRDKLKPYFD